MRIRKKSWALPYLKSHPEVVTLFSDTSEHEFLLFPTTQPVNLEIGMGKGNFLLDLAKRNPNELWVGIEQEPSVLAMATKRLVEELSHQNVKLLNAHLDWIMDLIPDQCIDTIYLNFSDPWPKARHEKRRLTSTTYIPFYRRILKPHGRVLIKTDNESLYRFTRELWPTKEWKVIIDSADYSLESTDALTEYEAKFRAQGIAIKRLVYEKE